MRERSLYKKINPKIKQKISALLDNAYEQAALGTIDRNQWPLVTKVIPLIIRNNIYLLLSDLRVDYFHFLKNQVQCYFLK